MYSSIFVNFLIYVHICSSQIVFLLSLAAHTAKCFLNLFFEPLRLFFIRCSQYNIIPSGKTFFF